MEPSLKCTLMGVLYTSTRAGSRQYVAGERVIKRLLGTTANSKGTGYYGQAAGSTTNDQTWAETISPEGWTNKSIQKYNASGSASNYFSTQSGTGARKATQSYARGGSTATSESSYSDTGSGFTSYGPNSRTSTASGAYTSTTTASSGLTQNKVTSTSSTSTFNYTPTTTTTRTQIGTYPTVGRSAESITYYTSYEKSKPYNISFRSTTSVNPTFNLKTGIASTTRTISVQSTTQASSQRSSYLVSTTTSGTTSMGVNQIREFIHEIITIPAQFSDTRVWYGVRAWYATNVSSSGVFTKCFKSTGASLYTVNPKFDIVKSSVKPVFYDLAKEPTNTVLTSSTFKIQRLPGHKTNTESFPNWDPELPDYTERIVVAPYTDYTTNEETYVSTTGATLPLGYDSYGLVFGPNQYGYYSRNQTATTAYTITDAVYFKYSKVLRKSKTTSYSYQISTTSGTRIISTTSHVTYPELFTTEAITLPRSFTTTILGTNHDPHIEFLGTLSTALTYTEGFYDPGIGVTIRALNKGTLKEVYDYSVNDVKLKHTLASRLDSSDDNQFKVTYKTSPDGFIGFAGSFDSDVKSTKVFRSITTSKKGNPFSDQYEFNIYDYPELFASCRKGGIIIVPEIFTQGLGYTLSAGPAPESLATQATFTAFYTSTTNTTAATETTTRSLFTEYRLTRTRTNTTVQTGETQTVYPYTARTTKSISATRYTETSVEYVIGFASPVTGTYFAESAAHTRLAEHPCIPAQVTYGTAGDFAGYHDSVISLKPCIFNYTLLSTSTATQSSSTLFTNLTSSMLLTISKDHIMIFEMEPLYSISTVLYDFAYLQYSTHKKYTFE